MHRSIVAAVLGLTLVLTAGPVLANTCPKLVKQIEDATATRFDSTAAEAKVKAKQGADLHAAGKHEESEKILREALTSLGIK